MGQTVPRLRRWIVITWTSRANNTLRSHTDLAAQNLSLHRHRFSSLRFRLLPLRLVHAVGFFREQIAGERVRASARAATDLAKLAAPALTVQIPTVAQGAKQRRVAIDVGQRLFADVASGDRQKSAGIDLAQVRDEHEAFAVVDTAGAPDPVTGLHANGHLSQLGHALIRTGSVLCATAGLGAALQQEAPVVLGFGALDVEQHALRGFVQLLEDLLEFFRRDEIDALPAARGNQEEDAPQRNVQFLQQRDGVVEHGEVVAGDGGVDLHRQSDLACPADRIDGPLIRAGYAAKGIVDLCSRTIQRYRQACQAALL